MPQNSLLAARLCSDSRPLRELIASPRCHPFHVPQVRGAWRGGKGWKGWKGWEKEMRRKIKMGGCIRFLVVKEDRCLWGR